MCEEPHHWNKKQTLSEWLQKEGIPGIEGIDTRQLTKILREKGTMRGKIVIEGDEEKNVDFVDPSKFNLVKEVSVKVGINSYFNPGFPVQNNVRHLITFYFHHTFPQEPMVINPNGNPRILVVDCGLKHNQLRCLKGKKIMALTLTL